MSKVTTEELFKALSNEIRIDILRSLEEHERCVMDIVKELKYDQTTVSHNLKHLSDCGFVFVHKQGKNRIYKLNERTIGPLMKIIEKHMQMMKEELR